MVFDSHSRQDLEVEMMECGTDCDDNFNNDHGQTHEGRMASVVDTALEGEGALGTILAPPTTLCTI